MKFNIKQFKEKRKQRIIAEFAPAEGQIMAEYERLAKKYQLSVPTIINYIREGKK